MRIIGRRDARDYFDHIGSVYGEDDRVVYVRAPFKQTEFVVPPEVGRALGSGMGLPRPSVNGRWAHLCCVVAACWVIPVLRLGSVTGQTSTEIADPVRHASWLTDPSTGGPLPTPDLRRDLVDDLVRSVGAPVFLVRDVRFRMTRTRDGREGEWLVAVSARVPHLGALGVPAIVPAEQMWQEVYATCSNVLRRDPDKMPPTEVSNEDKIHTYGFDRRTSFRHPVR
jgi:hypothetical protein